MRQFSNPASIHEPAASYSHNVVVEDERLLITSGQIGMLPDGTMPNEPHAQLAIAFDNVRSNLESAGMTMTDLIKLTIYLVGPSDPTKRRQQIAEALGSHRPTMTVLYVSALGTDEMKVEIEAVASVSA